MPSSESRAYADVVASQVLDVERRVDATAARLREKRTNAFGEPIPTPPGPYDIAEVRRLCTLVATAARRFGWRAYVMPEVRGNWIANFMGTYWTSLGLGGSTSDGTRLVPNTPEVPWTNDAAYFNPYGTAIERVRERLADYDKRAAA